MLSAKLSVLSPEPARDPAQHSALDLIASLVDQSLLRQEEGGDGEPRVRMLETIREFGLAQLAASGEEEAARQVHATYFLELAEHAAPKLEGPEQATWLARLDADHDNLRAALSWTLGQGEAEPGLRLAVSLWRFWEVRGYLGEGRGWLARALDAGADAPAPLRAQALRCVSALARNQGDYAEALAHGEAALALFEQSGDRHGMATMLVNLGNVALDRVAFAEAARRYEEGLARFRALGDRVDTALALNNLGLAQAGLGAEAEAMALYTESLELSRALGNDRLTAMTLGNLATLASHRGERERATALAEESLALRRTLGDRSGLAWSLHELAPLVLAGGDAARALALSGESLALFREIGDKVGIAACLDWLAQIAAPGQPERAARLLGAADALREAMGTARDADAADAAKRCRATIAAALRERTAATIEAGRSRPLDAVVGDALSVVPPVAPASPNTVKVPDVHGLTERELDVLRLIAEGQPDREIAAVLFVSPRTVGGHVTNILNKLGVNSRAAAAAYAVRHGLV